jgi:hypothetical protein
LLQKAYSTVVGVMDLVEFFVCEAEAGGVADIEVGEDLKVDFGGEGFESCGGQRHGRRQCWIMLLASKNGSIDLEERKRGMMLTRHGCD